MIRINNQYFSLFFFFQSITIRVWLRLWLNVASIKCHYRNHDVTVFDDQKNKYQILKKKTQKRNNYERQNKTIYLTVKLEQKMLASSKSFNIFI